MALILGALVAGVALAAGVTFAADRLVSDDSPPEPVVTGPGPCDPDGVIVGYDIGYDKGLAGFAVLAVRVIGIDPACDGAKLAVSLADDQGDSFAGAVASGSIEGSSLRLALGPDVPADRIRRVLVSIDGHFQPNIPPPVVPAATSPTPGALLAPSLCPTVTGAISVDGRPAECGAVSAAPTTSPLPVPVASWRAGTFLEPVRVTLAIPDSVGLPLLRVSVGGAFVQLSVALTSDGSSVASWPGVVAIDFPAQPEQFDAVFSRDGRTWTRLPQLQSNALPDGQADGYFVHPDRSVIIYTRHATYFALVPPPGPISLTHAKLLPSGSVRLTWTPSAAGLGVTSYLVARDGRRLATVPGSKTIALLQRLPPVSRLRVVAVDPLGNRSPGSPLAIVRMPLLVGARVEQPVGPTLRAQVRLTARAGLRFFVLDARGSRLVVLPGSTVAGRAVAAATTEVRTGSRRAGLYRIEVRLRRAQLRPSARYRVVVLARAPRRESRAEIRFRGPA